MEYLNELIADCVSTQLTLSGCVVRLMLSMVLGCLVGMERKRKGQIAGIRTFALISMGATLAMLVSIWVPQELMGDIHGDPTRIAAQVVSGIGFLGAGAIIQMKGSVRGLTTAAGIWMVAMIGLAVGCGLYVVSMIATVMILFILILLENIEHRVNMGSYSRTVRLRLPEIVKDFSPYRTCMERSEGHVVNMYIEYDYDANETRLNLVILVHESVDYAELLQRISNIYPTSSVSISNQPGF
ncbi:MAG: MgtC/SapB family protein [Candidatus Amulumruptor caecigallinarius]|nr:MgtC/SapB family protein [Candidatus Amulumruptor caecigallinarius]MCM1397723.1 MgtC/SapB family protein [Candidatus Amulumruptor caecigallinarius]MCM1454627.1 MgtC/SapB family protein [bacterium]